MSKRHYGINGSSNECYGVATALTYWVFRCRNHKTTPANGIKTWTFLESAIKNSAEVSATIEDYLQRLSDALHSILRPELLTKVVSPNMKIFRVMSDLSEIQELNIDQEKMQFMGWQDLLDDIARFGFSDWDVLDLCRNKATIIQVLCRLRFEEDRSLGLQNEEIIDVESDYVE